MERRYNLVDPAIGYTDKVTLKLDLDETNFEITKQIADYMVVGYNLEGYIILKSSENNYHIIFDKTIDWETNCNLMARSVWKLKSDGLTRWFTLQIIKGSSTLRISNKGEKNPPKIIYKFGRQSGEIKNYLECCELFKDVIFM